MMQMTMICIDGIINGLLYDVFAMSQIQSNVTEVVEWEHVLVSDPRGGSGTHANV